MSARELSSDGTPLCYRFPSQTGADGSILQVINGSLDWGSVVGGSITVANGQLSLVPNGSEQLLSIANPCTTPGNLSVSGALVSTTLASPMITVTGAYQLPAAPGVNGQVLTTNGAGLAIWQTNSTGGAVDSVTAGANINVTGSTANPVVALASDVTISGLLTAGSVDSVSIAVGNASPGGTGYALPTARASAPGYYIASGPTISAGSTSWLPIPEGGVNAISSASASQITISGTSVDPIIGLPSSLILLGSIQTAPGSTLSVGGNYSLPVNDGSAGQLLETNGAGVVSWVTGGGGGGGISAVGGTINQIDSSTVGGTVTLSLPGSLILPGSISTAPGSSLNVGEEYTLPVANAVFEGYMLTAHVDGVCTWGPPGITSLSGTTDQIQVGGGSSPVLTLAAPLVTPGLLVSPELQLGSGAQLFGLPLGMNDLIGTAYPAGSDAAQGDVIELDLTVDPPRLRFSSAAAGGVTNVTNTDNNLIISSPGAGVKEVNMASTITLTGSVIVDGFIGTATITPDQLNLTDAPGNFMQASSGGLLIATDTASYSSVLAPNQLMLEAAAVLAPPTPGSIATLTPTSLSIVGSTTSTLTAASLGCANVSAQNFNIVNGSSIIQYSLPPAAGSVGQMLATPSAGTTLEWVTAEAAGVSTLTTSGYFKFGSGTATYPANVTFAKTGNICNLSIDCSTLTGLFQDVASIQHVFFGEIPVDPMYKPLFGGQVLCNVQFNTLTLGGVWANLVETDVSVFPAGPGGEFMVQFQTHALYSVGWFGFGPGLYFDLSRQYFGPGISDWYPRGSINVTYQVAP